MDEKPQGTTSVKLTPISWEWNCPTCGTHNTENDLCEIVTCSKTNCGTSFFMRH